MATASAQPLMRRCVQVVKKSLIVAVTSGVLVEVCARIWLLSVADDSQFVRFASYRQIRQRTEKTQRPFTRHMPHRYLGFTNAPGYVEGSNRHNEWGFRGDPVVLPKPDGEYRIVCMGGSTTYTTYVPDYHKSYPALLEKNLRAAGYDQVRVINAGTPAYSTLESLISFELRILDLDPDMIIVYHGVNDVFPRMVWPPDAYFGDARGSAAVSPGFYEEAPFLERSTAARILMVWLGWADSHASLVKCFFRFPESAHWIEYINQCEAGTYPSGIFKEIDALRMIEANPPIYFRRNLENLLALAAFRDIDALLVTFPLCTKVPGHNATPPVVHAVSEHNEVTKEVGKKMGVPVFDLASIFPNDPKLFWDPDHVNEEGVVPKARMIADFVLGTGLLPKP